MVVAKPGWHAKSVFWASDGHIGVRWVDARYAGKPDANAGEGSALAIRYRLDSAEYAHVISTVRGSVNKGRDLFPQQESDGPNFPFPFDSNAWDDARRLATDAPYSWERSHFGSVRARLRSKVEKSTPTVFWDGLRASQVRSRAMSNVLEVFGLGGNLGASILFDANLGRSAVVVYDAASRSRVALFQHPDVTDAAWIERAQLLLLQMSTGNGKVMGFRVSQ